MKKIVWFLLASLMVLCFVYNLQPVKATPANELVVYIGAHPDDIDIGMSGCLFKHDVGVHPILWIVVTDGGADMGEYDYEVDSSRSWVSSPYVVNASWPIPYLADQYITRTNMSQSLASKRCGGSIVDASGEWQSQGASHNSSFNTMEYDWMTRVSNNVSSTGITKVQLSYYYYITEGDRPIYVKYYEIYPDNSLSLSETAFKNSIAKEVAKIINQTVVMNNYTKNQLFIDSHAPDEVANLTGESADHIITGNAVRLAIDYLHDDYTFNKISATWFTIYSPISPWGNFSRTDEDVSSYKTQKSNLCKACWETEHLYTVNEYQFGTWNAFPTDPKDYEYVVTVDYNA